ncbi:hypothetical protein Cgig2_010482 [Carnegiea gigantea]|uniref:Uncharacterized protein n=1 Tax=Carnegiea gigantea TaxID=171969 RepID=A0A9Q1KRP1_9CARY|nr:hypothetical protein Cgig2_010482 [Carnegiea gigantea]
MGAPSLISTIDLHQVIPSMAFPRSLSIGEMAEYVTYHFEWDRHGVAFSLLLLPNDFQPCARAMNVLWPRKLLELPQVIFYGMLLNEAKRLGVLHGRTLRIMESAIAELCWSTFENEDQVFEAQFRKKAEHEEESSNAEGAASPSGDDKQRRKGALHAPFIMAFPPLYDTREMADFMRGSFRWHWRIAICPPHPLPEDYQDLCLRFTLSDAERAALDFELPEMVQVTFYAILLNDDVELGIVSGFIVIDLKLTLEGLRLISFEAWLSRTSRKLREA